MLRRLFTALSALSLLLCVATAVLWVRSYREAHFVNVQGPGGEAVVWASRGQLAFYQRDLGRLPWVVRHRRSPDPPPVRMLQVMVIRNAYGSEGSAFTYRQHGRGDFRWLSFVAGGRRECYASLPAWSLCALLILPAAARTVLHVAARARRRVRPGQCRTCGYDLRATPGRCPECGTAAAAKDA